MGLHINKILAFFGDGDRTIKQQLFVNIGGIKRNEVLRQLSRNLAISSQDVWHVNHMTHGERWVDLPHFGSGDQPSASLVSGVVPSTTQDVEIIGAAHGLGQQFGGQDLFLTPDHAILQRGVDLVLLVQSSMNHLDVVHQAHEHVGLQGLHLIEIKRAEQTMPPAECGVGVDDQIGVLFDGMAAVDDVFEGGPPKEAKREMGRSRIRPSRTSGALRTSSSQHGKNRCGPPCPAKSTT